MSAVLRRCSTPPSRWSRRIPVSAGPQVNGRSTLSTASVPVTSSSCRSGASKEHSTVATSPPPKSSQPRRLASTPSPPRVRAAATPTGSRPAISSSGVRQ
ncbi:MAG: hypothetical protein E6I76_04545 [Chloroflexi bacterium]|nr:MAG: hypothetical protein E6J03_08295 [Chloroflexota bacterium]TMD98351.1 MAG: hypothetical protein E6I76_04545 [Chloroflexota bacterium]